VSAKEQLLQARKLIKEKRYEEARAILEKVDHPKAKEWLGQLNVRLAQKAPTKSSVPEQPAKQSGQTKAKSSRPRFLIPIVAIILLLVVAGGGAAIIVPMLTNQSADGAGDTQTIADAQSDDDNEPDDNSADESTGEDNMESDDTSTVSTASGEIVGSGTRLPIATGGDVLFSAELPEGYSCNCNISQNRIYSEEERTYFSVEIAARAFDPDYYQDKIIDEMLSETVDDDETIIGQETVQVNGRDVVIARVADEDGDTDISYNVKDSDGHIVRVTIPSFVDEPETLHDAALFVVGNVEANAGEEAEEFFTAMMANPVEYDETTDTWTFTDIDPSRQNMVALPEGWTMEPDLLSAFAIKDSDRDTSATAISYLRRTVRLGDGETLAQWVKENYLDFDNVVIESEEMVTVGDRDVVIFQVNDETINQRTLSFFLADSDDDFMVLRVQPFVEDPTSLQDDILIMAGTVESVEISWEEQLQRAGYLED